MEMSKDSYKGFDPYRYAVRNIAEKCEKKCKRLRKRKHGIAHTEREARIMWRIARREFSKARGSSVGSGKDNRYRMWVERSRIVNAILGSVDCNLSVGPLVSGLATPM